MSKRLAMNINLSGFKIDDNNFEFRNVCFDDYKAIGELDLLTIKDTIEFEGETLEESIIEMKSTFEGKYGTFLPQASYLIMNKGEIVSAVIFVHGETDDISLLAFAMTHVEYQNKGIIQFLLKRSINSLIDLGYKKACLGVKKGNDSAIAVYEKLGFKMSS